MNTQLKLIELQQKALENSDIKQMLLDTKNSAEPLGEFCKVCQSLGYEIYPGELIAAGEDFHDSMLRSVNGGGVSAPDGWEDAYEMFFSAIE